MFSETFKPFQVSYDMWQCARLFDEAFPQSHAPIDNIMQHKLKMRRVHDVTSQYFTSPEPASPSVDKENNTSPAFSPQHIIGGKRSLRHPLEDYDPNSQDSGYEVNYVEREELLKRDGFRFAEPTALAPRRVSIEPRSPMESPVRSSPQRARVALFRSVSSGYESMDDGFNDVIDTESLDDATLLPNGISTLISGDIMNDDSFVVNMSSPSTPKFTRSNRNVSNDVKRSVAFLTEKQEARRNSCSKVRSCLFRSPTASCSTSKLYFEDIDMVSPLLVNQDRQALTELSNRKLDSTNRTYKRSEPPFREILQLAKRTRISNNFHDTVGHDDTIATTMPHSKRTLYQRSFSESMVTTRMDIETEESEMQSESESHAQIKSAIHRSTTNANLTGDFSKPCVLPLAAGQHEDLRSISVGTLASLIHGEFNDRISSFKIVDCRYPYEFTAGHIQGALNLYSRDLIEQILLDPLTSTPQIQPDTNKRNILVFHCEFSWERGPNLSRILRNLDRQRNKEHYPALYYPEVYLLHGGYEKFYREHKELCLPQGYRSMRHPDHEVDLRQFRSKSKTWQGERPRISGSVTRSNLKRLGF